MACISPTKIKFTQPQVQSKPQPTTFSKPPKFQHNDKREILLENRIFKPKEKIVFNHRFDEEPTTYLTNEYFPPFFRPPLF